MENLIDIIKFENESNSLDFKKLEYHKNNHQEFIKDIISLANARTKNNRFIIIGVKSFPNGDKEFGGIPNLTDDAIYQQLIHNNVEPEIHFNYYPIEMDSKIYGVFELKHCDSPPYLMKKKYGNLETGSGFVRKGSHSHPLTRQDYDYYFSQRYSTSRFKGEIFITPIINGERDAPLPMYVKTTKYPSEKAKERLEVKKQKLLNGEIPRSFGLIGGYEIPNPEASTSTEQITDEIGNARDKYFNDDQYYFFEIDGCKLNFDIYIEGSDYVEDAYVELIIPNSEILYIAEEIYLLPDKEFQPGHLLSRADYPDVKRTEDGFNISQHAGDIRPNVTHELYHEPLRVIVWESKVPFKFTIRIHGKNLSKPISKEISIPIKK
jgi:hypothetical protein